MKILKLSVIAASLMFIGADAFAQQYVYRTSGVQGSPVIPAGMVSHSGASGTETGSSESSGETGAGAESGSETTAPEEDLEEEEREPLSWSYDVMHGKDGSWINYTTDASQYQLPFDGNLSTYSGKMEARNKGWIRQSHYSDRPFTGHVKVDLQFGVSDGYGNRGMLVVQCYKNGGYVDIWRNTDQWSNAQWTSMSMSGNVADCEGISVYGGDTGKGVVFYRIGEITVTES